MELNWPSICALLVTDCVASLPPSAAYGSLVMQMLRHDVVAHVLQLGSCSGVHSALGGVPNWQETFPNGCGLNTPWPACPWYCDKQSCDQCHPNDSGYFRLASAMKFGMNL
jgi:hypothetical protein